MLEAPLLESFRIERKKTEKILLGIILQKPRYVTMWSKDLKDRGDHNNPLIIHEVRQENSNGPFWPHALGIHRSRGGQQLHASYQNCYWGETPSEAETELVLCGMGREHPRNIHLCLLPVRMAIFCSFNQKAEFCHWIGYHWHSICLLGPGSFSLTWLVQTEVYVLYFPRFMAELT